MGVTQLASVTILITPSCASTGSRPNDGDGSWPLDLRVQKLELNQASQVAVRWAVALSLLSGPGSAFLTWLLTHHG